jgi:hypothetical protein
LLPERKSGNRENYKETIYRFEQWHKSQAQAGRARVRSLKDSSFSRLQEKDDFAVYGKQSVPALPGTWKETGKRKIV